MALKSVHPNRNSQKKQLAHWPGLLELKSRRGRWDAVSMPVAAAKTEECLALHGLNGAAGPQGAEINLGTMGLVGRRREDRPRLKVSALKHKEQRYSVRQGTMGLWTVQRKWSQFRHKGP